MRKVTTIPDALHIRIVSGQLAGPAEMAIANFRAIDFDLADDLRERKFQRTLALIEERLTTPPGLTELARAVGAIERKLTEIFRQRPGLTVFDYINQRRLECSRRLRDSSSLRVRQISNRLGSRNPGDSPASSGITSG